MAQLGKATTGLLFSTFSKKRLFLFHILLFKYSGFVSYHTLIPGTLVLSKAIGEKYVILWNRQREFCELKVILSSDKQA